MLKRQALMLGLVLLAGCSMVRRSYVRPDYEQEDKYKVKRLVVVTQPLPAGQPQVGELWSLVARRYANQNRKFIARANVALAGEPADPAFRELCTEGGHEGVLWLRPTTVERRGEGVEAGVQARLLRCADGQEVWSAEAAGSNPSVDPQYTAITEQYTNELGPEVTPYVAPTFRLMKAALDTLPYPELTSAEEDEKIELGE